MGTNYYLKQARPCPTCGHLSDTEVHIGKSTPGYCFALRIYPCDASMPKTLDDWKVLFEDDHLFIYDDGGNVIDAEHMMEIITDRGDNLRRCAIEGAIHGGCEDGPLDLIPQSFS